MKEEITKTEEDDNSEFWKQKYITACKETGTVEFDSASSRISGHPMTYKERTNAIYATNKFIENIREACNKRANMKTGIEFLSENTLEPQHKEAIIEEYVKNGISDDIDERLKFWEDDQYYFSHNPSKELRLALHEQSFLAQVFPKEFQLY